MPRVPSFAITAFRRIPPFEVSMSDVRSRYTDGLKFYGTHSPRELLDTYGSPLYVYNEAVLRDRCRRLKNLSSHPGFGVNYSVKANANPTLLRIIREEGLVVDAMSPGEIYMDKLAGFSSDQILYIANNISQEEMRHALDEGLLISVDSLSQIETLGRINGGGKIMVRFNPGIGAGHHQKVVTAGKETKFGVTPDLLDDVLALLKKYNMTLAGINQHIGSLFMEADGYIEAAKVLLHLADRLPADVLSTLEIIDFGGGPGIPYHKYDGEAPLDMDRFGKLLHELMTDWSARTGYQGRFLIEPGRFVVAECGVILTGVNNVKYNGPNCYVGTDVGFNVLARPAMYDSFHDMEIYAGPAGTADRAEKEQTIVGNICESGDILARKRLLPAMHEGDVLGILDAGAYGFSMSSSYTQRCRSAEVLIDLDGKARLIRRRETPEDLARQYEGLL